MGKGKQIKDPIVMDIDSDLIQAASLMIVTDPIMTSITLPCLVHDSVEMEESPMYYLATSIDNNKILTALMLPQGQTDPYEDDAATMKNLYDPVLCASSPLSELPKSLDKCMPILLQPIFRIPH